jgi:hypothetical protein
LDHPQIPAKSLRRCWLISSLSQPCRPHCHSSRLLSAPRWCKILNACHCLARRNWGLCYYVFQINYCFERGDIYVYVVELVPRGRFWSIIWRKYHDRDIYVTDLVSTWKVIVPTQSCDLYVSHRCQDFESCCLSGTKLKVGISIKKGILNFWHKCKLVYLHLCHLIEFYVAPLRKVIDLEHEHAVCCWVSNCSFKMKAGFLDF